LTFYLAITILVALSYLILQVYLTVQWNSFHLPTGGNQVVWPIVSVVVPMRNEENRVPELITSLLKQDYPQSAVEFILIDNHSTDNTLAVVRKMAADLPGFRVIALADYLPEDQAFKKEALAEGFRQSRGSMILTTDADCRVPPTWIRSMIGNLIAERRNLVTGPVVINSALNEVEKYQQLDLCGLMVATGGGLRSRWLLMANGANLAFRKNQLEAPGGYYHESLASGDDVFLLHQFYREQPEKVGFVRDPAAMVVTRACPDLTTLIRQRRRWASKAGHYRHGPTKGVAVVVFINSLLLLVHLVFAFLGGSLFFQVFLVHLLIKVLADSVLLRAGTSFFRIPFSFKQRLFAHFINPVLNGLIPLSVLMVKSYQWKDRTTT
jgi:poly-beta-1,6-N-acetyl-D-glucosamine synthase